MGQARAQDPREGDVTVEVRPYRADDRAACWSVFDRAVHEGAAAHYTPAERMAWSPGVLPHLAGADKLLQGWTRVAVRGDRIVGFMTLDAAGELDMAYVLPEEMGRGTAQALYDAILDQARARGLARLTSHASLPARSFLMRQGWRCDAPDHVERGGQTLTRFAMSVDLADEGMAA